jgi:hypothetical protein
LGPHTFRAGDEFFVSHEAASAGVQVIPAPGEALEMFTFFAAPMH